MNNEENDNENPSLRRKYMHNMKGTYTNTAEIYDSEGYKIDKSSDTVNVETIRWISNSMATRCPLPFTITLNNKGEDLMPDSGSVSVVDTMSPNLRLDPSSITVKNLLTERVLPTTDWTVAVDGQTFILTVPDSQPLFVNYNAYCNASDKEGAEKTSIPHPTKPPFSDGVTLREKYDS